MSIAIKRSFSIPSTSAIGASELVLTSGTSSTSTGTGALTVSGGAGFGSTVSVGGNLRLFNGSVYTELKSSASANKIYTLPDTTPSTGTSVLQSDSSGNMSWVSMSSGTISNINGITTGTQYFTTVISGSGFTISSTGSTHTFNLALAGNASTGLISSASQTIFGAKTFASGVAITSGTGSTSTSTGDLVITGGVGIGGSLFTQTLTVGSGVTGLFIQKMVGGNYVAMYSTNVTPSGTNYTFITDGQSPNFNGTNGVYFNISNSNKVQITNTNINVTPTTGSTSTSTGSLTVSGGVGIGGSLWTATTNYASISGVGFSNSVVTSGVWSGTAISATNGGTGLASYTTGDILYASSTSTIGKIAAGTAGSVLTSAGAGTTPYWASAGSSSLVSTIVSTGTRYLAALVLNTASGSTQIYTGSGITIGDNRLTTGGLAVTSGTASTNTTTGALTVTGGVGITGQLSVNTVALGVTGVSGTPTMTFTGTAGTVITMSVRTDTTLAFEGSSGQLFSVDNVLNTGEIFSVNDISGLPLITASAGQTISLNEFGGFTQVGNGLATTSTTSGALRVIGGIGVTGNVAIGGTFIRSQWAVGETIQTAMYNYSDLTMGSTSIVSGTGYSRIGGVTFTPRSSSSYLWIEFNARYDFNSGTNGDDFWSDITVNGTEIVASNQIFISATGGGTRSGTLFPLMARYTNSGTAGLAITVQAKRGTSDDNIRIYGDAGSGYMRIQEIAR